jgi:hypothetical protein
VEYNAVTNSAESVGNMMRTVDDVVGTVTNLVRNNEVLNPESSFKYLQAKLKSIDLDLAELMTDNDIKKAVDKINSEREGGEGGGGDDNFGY